MLDTVMALWNRGCALRFLLLTLLALAILLSFGLPIWLGNQQSRSLPSQSPAEGALAAQTQGHIGESTMTVPLPPSMTPPVQIGSTQPESKLNIPPFPPCSSPLTMPQPGPTALPVVTPTVHPQPHPTPRPRPSPSPSPQPQPSPIPAPSPSPTPAPTPTPAPSPTPTPTPIPAPSPSPTPPSPTPTPTPAPSPSPSPPAPTATPSAAPTPSPDPEPTEAPFLPTTPSAHSTLTLTTRQKPAPLGHERGAAGQQASRTAARAMITPGSR